MILCWRNYGLDESPLTIGDIVRIVLSGRSVNKPKLQIMAACQQLSRAFRLHTFQQVAKCSLDINEHTTAQCINPLSSHYKHG